jgi:hypothetical protein
MPRFFDAPQAGQERDEMLATFRYALRDAWLGRVDPALDRIITEEDIQAATQEGSKYYAEFQAVDHALLVVHSKAVTLADQAFPRRATSGALARHGEQRDLPRLPAVGATLYCTAEADVGAVFVGSTTIPDSAAAYATYNGMTFQLLYDVTTPANGIAGSEDANPLILVGVDTGEVTNLPAGTALSWAGNQPLSAVKPIAVVLDGSGGTDAESENEWSQRLADDDAHKAESGNAAHVRRWGREASVAVEDIFVYSCAKYSGTDVVCVTQKRGRQVETAPKGPLARIPTAGTLSTVRARLVPPGSPVSPERGVRFVVAPQSEYVDMSIGLALPRGRGLGWAQSQPWPTWEGAPAEVGVVTTQLAFEILTDAEIPSSSTVPRIMVWRRDVSRWEELRVSAIVTGGAGVWDVTLSAAPEHTITAGDYISPATRSPKLLAQAIERYFDSLGPGEVIDLDTDTRAPRAARFPDPVERYPQRAGSAILTTIGNALVGAVPSGELLETSATLPTVPDDPTDGPGMLVCGRIAVYPSD